MLFAFESIKKHYKNMTKALEIMSALCYTVGVTNKRRCLMRKNFGVKNWLYPMPVFIVGSYDENGTPNAMNAAWGGIYDTNLLMVCLADEHKTTENIKKTGCFTVSFATEKSVVMADYVGIVSANDNPDKVKSAGLHSFKSEFVNAPLFEELPVAVECRLLKFNEDGICIGEIVNVSADESVVAEDGKIDHTLLAPICYDSVRHNYIGLGKVVGKAFSDGKKLL